MTGCSSGIGMATAIELAEHGHTVVATVRGESGADRLRERADLARVSLDIRQLDVTDDAAAAGCVAAVVEAHGGLGALVNNAGTARLDVFEVESMADFRDVLEVNLFGVVRLTKLALPHLRASGGRLIAVSSVGGVVGQPFNEAYCAAKFAVEGVYESLAPVASRLGVRVSLIEPGPVSSNLTSGIDLQALVSRSSDYGDVAASSLATPTRPDLDHPFRDSQTPEQVAGLIREVLEAPDPAFRYPTSENARNFIAKKLDDLDGRRLQAVLATWLAPNGG